TCSRVARTFAPSRKCSATQTSPRRSCTRTSTATTCGRCTRRFIREAEPSMSRAFVKEESGEPGPRRNYGLPPRDDPGFDARAADPPVGDLSGRTIRDVRRLGKRIVLALEGEYFIVLHLMIAGRLHWKPAGAPIPRRAGLAAFDFPNGTLLLTEAGTKHRASLHLVRGERALAAHDPGGLDVLAATLGQFRRVLAGASHTLK